MTFEPTEPDASPNPAPGGAPYEPPEVEPLGTLSEFTKGNSGPGADTFSGDNSGSR